MPRTVHDLLTFERCAALLAHARGGRRKLGNNTYLEPDGPDAFCVRLHSTCVVTVRRDGTYTLQSGGWQTVTTRARMNTYSPASIGQERGVWYLAGRWLYADGMAIDSHGHPINPVPREVKMMTERAAWLYLARAWDAAKRPFPWSSPRVSIEVKGLTRTSSGLCGCIRLMKSAEKITDDTAEAMTTRIGEALAPGNDPIETYPYITSNDEAGAKYRAKFCRKQAAALTRKRKPQTEAATHADAATV